MIFSISSTKKALNQIEEYFNIFLKPKLINCFFSKITILGEGFAEQTLFNCFKEKFKEKEYSSSIHFETLHGKDFISFFADFLISLDLTPIIIFDEDSNKDQTHKETNNYLNTNYQNKISFTKDLEATLSLEIPGKDNIKKAVLVPLAIENAFITKQEPLDNLLTLISQKIEQIYRNKTN